MSKAFDTVRRSSLLQQLKQIVGKDELHIIKILITDKILKVRIGQTIGPKSKQIAEFHREIGLVQYFSYST